MCNLVRVESIDVSTLYEALLSIETRNESNGTEISIAKNYRNKLGSYYTPDDLARTVTKKTINKIIKGKYANTPQTSLQFERVLGVSDSFWNNLEKNYREVLVRREEKEKLEKQIPVLKQIPIREMEKRNWIEKADTINEQLENALVYFGVSDLRNVKKVSAFETLFRKSKKSKSDLWTVIAWLRRGESEAQKAEVNISDKNKFK